MLNKKLSVWFVLCCMLIGTRTLNAQNQVLTSPNGKLTLTFKLNQAGTPTYQLRYKDLPVIKDSELGMYVNKDFLIEGQKPVDDLVAGFKVASTATDSHDEYWEPVWGEVAKIRNQYNELLVNLVQEKTDRQMNLRFRLFDDGLGFRYEFPDQPNLIYFVVKQEHTQFAMPGNETAFWIPGDYDTEEYNYDKCKLSEIRMRYDSVRIGNCSQKDFSKTGVQTPLMLKYNNGLYVNIHEAALIDFPAINLELDDKTMTFTTHLTPDALGNRGYIQTAFNTPWRTVIVSDDARDILASKLVYNLNEPCKIEDTSWIKPVKYMGVWWEMITGKSDWAYTHDINSVHIGQTDYTKVKPSGRHAANTKHVCDYIDFASANGIKGLLVEGWNIGWEDWFGKSKDFVFDFLTPYPDFDLPYICDYAKQKGVDMIMHHETSGSIRNYERFIDRAYDFMVENNYKYLKSGYVGNIIPRGEYHYGQWMVNHYLTCVQKAAEKKIMVNAHEAVHMTGLSRTYPNLLAQESAKGQEYQSFGGNNPDHLTILPFTRLIGGPMDYTPGVLEMDLSKVNPDRTGHVNSTICNQLGTYLTMYSPLQMAADLIENYKKYPVPFEFIKAVPVEWQDSKYLEAEPGEYITVARKDKHSENWYIGNVTGNTPHSTQIKLDFLTPGKKYKATIYQDGKKAHYKTNPTDYKRTTQVVTSKSVLKLYAAVGGGFAVELKELK